MLGILLLYLGWWRFVGQRRRLLSWEFCGCVSVGVDCFDGGTDRIHAMLAQDGRTAWSKECGIDIAKMSLTWLKDYRKFYCSVSVCGDCIDGGAAPIHSLLVQNRRTHSLVEGMQSI